MTVPSEASSDVDRGTSQRGGAALAPGVLLASTYELQQIVGRGAFGEVWQAQNVLTGEAVALKFTTEPRAIAALRNEIVQIQRLQRAQAGQRGLVRFQAAHFEHSPPFVVMDFAPGGDMSAWIAVQKRRPPETAKALAMVRPALEGLVALHSAGHVHRDIKPSNFLLFNDGFRLADFGIGAVLVAEEVEMSFIRSAAGGPTLARDDGTAGLIAGTFGYLAPEVMRGEVAANDFEAWRRADTYSLGVTLVQFLTADPDRLAGAIRRSDSLPDALAEGLEQCVESDPRARPAVDADFRGRLLAAAAQRSWSALTPMPTGEPKREITGWESGTQAGERRVFKLSGGVEMPMRWIPPGEFLMGSPASEEGRGHNEGPQTFVRLTPGCWMAETETTQAQYEAIVGANPSKWKGANLPVEQVSWDDAKDFCRKLSSRSGATVGLPTEAQWEYACRAGTTTPFHFGASISTDQANCDGSATCGSGENGTYRRKTTPVGSFPASAWGLFDMHGNVWEWCQDWYTALSGGAVTNPSGPSDGTLRVARGGAYLGIPQVCRSAYRGGVTPDARYMALGFCVVLLTEST